MRYYNSSTGRFISEDPIGFESSNLNLYQYVANGVMSYNDPFGDKRRSSVSVLPDFYDDRRSEGEALEFLIEYFYARKKIEDSKLCPSEGIIGPFPKVVEEAMRKYEIYRRKRDFEIDLPIRVIPPRLPNMYYTPIKAQ